MKLFKIIDTCSKCMLKLMKLFKIIDTYSTCMLRLGILISCEHFSDIYIIHNSLHVSLHTWLVICVCLNVLHVVLVCKNKLEQL